MFHTQGNCWRLNRKNKRAAFQHFDKRKEHVSMLVVNRQHTVHKAYFFGTS